MIEPIVLEETDKWLVLDKPTSWHTVSRPGDDETAKASSVEGWLQTARPELSGIAESGLVHRLDFGTSGCLLVAKSEAECNRLRLGMRDGSIRKTYQAIASGRPDKVGQFKLYFTSRYKRSKQITVSRAGDGRSLGVCAWRRVQANDECSLLEINLQGSGRRHQVRAGFSFLGHPLLGDALYDGPLGDFDHAALDASELLVDGVRVHSARPFQAWIAS